MHEESALLWERSVIGLLGMIMRGDRLRKTALKAIEKQLFRHEKVEDTITLGRWHQRVYEPFLWIVALE